MQAIVYHKYGAPGVLELREVDKPALTDDGVLVRVRASSVNPAEWYAVTGTPYVARTAMGLRRPKHAVPGADFAGTVAAVGSAVTELRPGDAVYGGTSSGAFAEYVCVRNAVVPKANRWIGPLGHVASVRLASLGASQKVVFFVAKFNREDFVVLQELLEAGKVAPVIDRRYALSELPEALRYLGEGHARGKVVITV